MFSMPATTYGQTLPPITLALSQGVASATTIGSIPSRAVYSAIALPELQNQRGGGAAYTAVSSVATAATQPVASAAQNLARIQSAGGSADFSVAFFAQLLGQSSEAVQSQLTLSFPHIVPMRAGDPATMEVYSQIKYLPSAAAKPVPVPQAPEFAAPKASVPSAATQSMMTASAALPVRSGEIVFARPAAPAPSSGSSRILGRKTPAEAYQQAATRKVSAADDKMDAAA